VEDPPPSGRTFWIVAAAGALLYLLTAITNPGIIAADDYGDVISRVIPAQAHSVQEIGAKAGFRSPFTPLTHFAIVSAAHAVGVDHPLTQFRIDLAVAGLFSFFLTLWAGCNGNGRDDGWINDITVQSVNNAAAFKVVKNFIGRIKEQATGAELSKSLSPAQQVIKIVHEELTSLMGSGGARLPA